MSLDNSPETPVVKRTRRAASKVAAEKVVSTDADSEGLIDARVADDADADDTNTETIPLNPSHHANDEADSYSGSDYVPNRYSKRNKTISEAEFDVSATPADTVKKRRRTPSWKIGTNGPKIVSVPDEESGERKSRKKSENSIANEAKGGKPQRKSGKNGTVCGDSIETKLQRRSRNKNAVEVSGIIDHRKDIIQWRGEDSGNASSCSPHGDDALPEILVTSWKEAIKGVGQEFESVFEFIEALRRYAIANCFTYKLTKSGSRRAIGVCANEGCPWNIHAVWVPSSRSFKIKILDEEHTCILKYNDSGHRKRNWFLSTIKERLRNSRKKVKEIAHGILRDSEVELRMDDGRELLHCSPQDSKDSYNKLPSFCEKIIETNPGSFSKLIMDADRRFKSLFVSFYASIQGFQKGCRPIIFLEATSLKSEYQEVLFTANAIDGNDGFLPVAFAIVSDENEDTWLWFLLQIKNAISDARPITFVSDMEKNLKKSILEVFPTGHHGYSIYHLLESFKRNVKGPFHGDGKGFLTVHFLAAAHTVRINGFKKATEQIKQISLQAYDWVLQVEPEHWANSFFKGERYNYVDQDVGESYINLLEDTQNLPILEKIGALVRMVIDLVDDERAEASAWHTKLTPLKEKYLQEEKIKSSGLKVLISSDTMFEVREDFTHVVDVSTWDCSCLGWKQTGLPCRHALAIFNSTNKNAYDYCSEYFTVDTYQLTYCKSINQVPTDGMPVDLGEVDSALEKEEEVLTGNGETVEKEEEGGGWTMPMEEVGDLNMGDDVEKREHDKMTVNGKPVERECDPTMAETPVEEEQANLTVFEKALDKEEGSTVNDKPSEKEEGEKGGGDSTLDKETVEEGKEGHSTLDATPAEEKEEGDSTLFADQEARDTCVEREEGNSAADTDAAEREVGNSAADTSPVEGERGRLAFGIKPADEEEDDMRERHSIVHCLPPVPLKPLTGENGEKPEWSETEGGEKRRTVTCTKCKRAGHNKKSCKAEAVQPV